MKTLEIIFCKELQDDLLKGAVIIYRTYSNVLCTILVRLPKDKFEKIEDGREFEYKQYQQENGGTMYHAVHRNGSKREVIRRTNEDHSETRYNITSAKNRLEKQKATK